VDRHGNPPVLRVADAAGAWDEPSDLGAAELYRLIAERTSDVLLVYAADRTLLWASPSLSRLLGYEPIELVGSRIDLTHPDDRDAWQAGLALALAEHRANHRARVRVVAADGRVLWADVSLDVGWPVAGSQPYSLVSMRDVSARVAAEEARADSERRYRLLADHATDVVLLSGSTGLVHWASPSTPDVLGWQPDELVGRRVSDLMHPDDLARVRQVQRDILAAGETEGRTQARFAAADGSWRWMSDHGRAILDDEGRIVGGIDALRDVQSEHAAAEMLALREQHYRELSRDLAASQQKLRGVIDSLVDPWVLLSAVRDEDGPIVDFAFVDANDAACAANHRTRDDLLGQRLLDLFPGHASSGLLAAYAAVVETGEPLVLDDEPFVSPFDGIQRRFDNRAVRVGDGISFTWRDVTDRYTLRQQLLQQADQDTLTGVANRRLLTRRLTETLERSPRTGTRLAVLYCDLDRFKPVNDSLGHATGDIVLTTVAARIRSAVRERDLVARFGGDEFVVVLDGVRDAADAAAVAGKISATMRSPVLAGAEQVSITVSVGVALAERGESADGVLARADAALYEAKRSGRDRVVLAADPA
jgi:diguanylate cyclase (GGDEF)-like protein/PAS domain S-box-containing protein